MIDIVDAMNGLVESADALVAAHDKDIDALKRTITQLEDQLQIVQARCSSLLDEARANRRIANAPPGELVALSHFSFERRRQDRKWGSLEKQIDVPNGTGITEMQTSDRDFAQMVCDDAFEAGEGTWADVLREEVMEALAESDPKRLRVELIEVGAVACKWVEILDRRANVNPLPATGGVPLPGWTCTAVWTVGDGDTERAETCGVFNGSNPKRLDRCRVCGEEAPGEGTT